jgi:hypothetical protein
VLRERRFQSDAIFAAPGRQTNGWLSSRQKEKAAENQPPLPLRCDRDLFALVGELNAIALALEAAAIGADVGNPAAGLTSAVGYRQIVSDDYIFPTRDFHNDFIEG